MAMRLRHSRWHRDAVMLWLMNHSMHHRRIHVSCWWKIAFRRYSSWPIIIVVSWGLAWWELPVPTEKTTTKELIAAVLKEKFNVLYTQGNFNNHIGVPLTLLRLKPEHEVAVIEMGANHPGEIKTLVHIAEPDSGIITNVGKAHLEGFGSFEVKKKAERISINPASKQRMLVPPKLVLSYRPSNTLKDKFK